MKAEHLEIKIFENRQLMGSSAATAVAVKIRELLMSQEEVNIIFASAPSQNEFLADLSNQENIAWERINAFHMDEYVSLPADSPQSFGQFLKNKLFDRISLKSVFYIDGNAKNIAEECERYAGLLLKYPTDIVCLGIGENCHLAFNDPHVADFNDPLVVKKVELDTPCRQQQINDGCFESLAEVPTHALTITIPALLKARFAYCTVPGKNKAQAVLHTVAEDVQELYPSTILRTHPHAIMFIDTESAGRLSETSSYVKA